MTFSLPVLVIGLSTGLTYAILAVGLVLVYKSARFINFSHGQLGALSAMLLAKLVNDSDIPYWPAFLLAIAVGMLVGWAVEVLVIRRLFEASRLVLMVATIGIAQVLYAVSFWHVLRPDPATLVAEGFPIPVDWTWTLSGQVIGGAELLILVVVPLSALFLSYLFKSTNMGLKIQAVASNPDGARLAGISVRQVSTLVWVLVGALAALTAILLSPSRGSVNTEILGPALMTRALAAALVGQMVSLPVAFGAGVALGVLEQVVFVNTSASGTTELVVFAVMMGVLLWRARGLAKVSRRSDDGVALAAPPEPLPRQVRDAPWLPSFRRTMTGLGVVIAALLPFLPGLDSQRQAYIYTLVVVYALLGVSLYVVTGWSGQLALGQYAVLGVGAYMAARLTEKGFSLPFVLIVAGLVGAVTSAVVGLPALRVRGVFLGVATLGFAVLAPGWLFAQSWFTGASVSSVTVGRPRLPIFGTLDNARDVYLASFVVLLLTVLVLRSLRNSGVGRRLIAVRDNPKGASAHGLPVSEINMVGFAISGFIAAVAGVLWGHANAGFDSNAFNPSLSLALLSMVIIGGLSSMAGPILGAVAVFGIPLLLDLDSTIVFFASGLGLVLTLLTNPGGMVTQFYQVRNWMLRGVATAKQSAELVPVSHIAPDDNVLVCENITMKFGELTALNDVSISVRAGEIVGLIGANGAGKTTLLDCISGYLRPVGGRVLVAGQDVTTLAPEYRGQCGMGRSFQDARLYPGLTVWETLLVAQERADWSGLFGAGVRAPWEKWSDQRKQAEAASVVELLKLGDVKDTLVADLPTGLRRVCDLGTVLLQKPKVVLLDEPTAGIPSSDVESFAPLLREIREDLDCAIVMIEHDMGLVMALADRIYALEAGTVIAEGTPDVIADHPAVVASYLGQDRNAIERSRQPRLPAAAASTDSGAPPAANGTGKAGANGSGAAPGTRPGTAVANGRGKAVANGRAKADTNGEGKAVVNGGGTALANGAGRAGSGKGAPSRTGKGAQRSQRSVPLRAAATKEPVR